MSWVQGSSGLKIPDSAVVLGKGENHTSIYVGSVLHEGKRVLAQVHPSKKAAYFHRYGTDQEMLYYKILCVPNSNWAKFNQSMPENALAVTLGTDTVFVGRSIVSPTKIYIGTVDPKEGMSVDFYGESAKIEDCEILVSGDVIVKNAEVKSVTNNHEIEAEMIKQAEEEADTEDARDDFEAKCVYNQATDDSSPEIENDNGLREYEDLEQQTAFVDDEPASLELIEEERDENSA